MNHSFESEKNSKKPVDNSEPLKHLKWHRFYRNMDNPSYEVFDFGSTQLVGDKINKVIETSPRLIRSAAAATNLTIEQMVVLYASSVMAGTLAPNAWINYDNKRSYLALMLMMVFPPANGKGIASQVRKLFKKINDVLVKDYNESVKVFKEKMREYRQNPTGLPPNRPKLKLVLAPGNTTSAKLIEMLSDLNGEQILTLFETELDALGIAAANDFGLMNSVVFRQAFHHEAISKMTKMDQEVQVADTPKLNVILTGTLNQVGKLLHSNDDGLVSRFMVVCGSAPLLWKDTRPCEECSVLDDHFEGLSKDFYEAWLSLKDKSVEVKFTADQWDAIQEFGEYHLFKSHHFTGVSSTSITKRHALMACRLAGIFTMLRYHEQGLSDSQIYCTDEDFGNSLWMIEYSLKCSLELFKTLPGERSEGITADVKTVFMRRLPNSFTSDVIKPIINELGLADRTASRWLKEFVDIGYIVRLKPGSYEKTPLAAAAVATSDKPNID